MTEWTYNDRPAGVRFLTDRIPEPGRTAVKDELWAWVVRGEADADEFVDVFEQQASYQADLERLLDEIAFPVLRKHGMRVEWNRKQSRRIRVTGAQWYAPLD
ncbi:hypothetical protein [Micromonospora sp. NPDC005171]|uniref:hypothetical protein n=1 Tax=Micromonospora sp. NPDC005171 TaxID=3156866 RepID=UPI0033B96A38